MEPTDVPSGRFRICDDVSEVDRVTILQALAMNGAVDPGIAAMANTVRQRSRSNRIADVAAECLNAAQHLKYEGHEFGEWFSDVPYTLGDGGGNCEDLSVVLVALCKRLGLEAYCIWIDQPGKPLNHVAVKIRVNGELLWADPSIAGARLGEDSYKALARLAPHLHPSDLEYRPARPYTGVNVNPRFPIPLPQYAQPAGAINTNFLRPQGMFRDLTPSIPSGIVPPTTPVQETDSDSDPMFLMIKIGGLPVWTWALIGAAVGVGAYQFMKKA